MSVTHASGAKLSIALGTTSYQDRYRLKSAVAEAWQDMDGDARPDLLMVSPRTPYVWVGRNLSLQLEL